MADVFVSYKKEDRPIAEQLVKALRAAGKSVWWDDALNSNQAWDAMIEAGIAASRHVIVLWTPRPVQSDWVRSEALYAGSRQARFLQRAEPRRALRNGFQSLSRLLNPGRKRGCGSDPRLDRRGQAIADMSVNHPDQTMR